MIATSFDESNLALGKPDDMTHDECEALSVWRGLSESGQPLVISCWKTTREELAEIARTGRVWLVVYGNTMPPVALCGSSPFPKSENDQTDGKSAG